MIAPIALFIISLSLRSDVDERENYSRTSIGGSSSGEKRLIVLLNSSSI